MIKKILTIPNLITSVRIFMLPVLFLLVFLDNRTAFIIVYVLTHLSDVFDGMVARRLNQVSYMGQKLDAEADALFAISTAFFAWKLFPDYVRPNLTLLFIMVACFVILVAVSWIKHGKILIVHTILLKSCAWIMTIVFILSFFYDTTLPIMMGMIIGILALLENVFILIKCKKVDLDTRSMFNLIKR